MEATLLPASTFPRSSTRAHLHRRLSSPAIASSPLTRSFSSRVLTRRQLAAAELSKCVPILSVRILCSAVPLVRCVSHSAASFASGGGSGVGSGSGGGGGGVGDGSDGGTSKVGGVSGAVNDVSALSPDVIMLDVRGMTCGGCAASVKRILESQPKVSSASVNLVTETAIVWPASEAKAVPNWQKELGETLANQLTTCGFESNLRDPGRDNIFRIFEGKIEEKCKQLKERGRGLAVSWTLCLLGHLSHFFGAKATWIHALHSKGFHLSLSLFILLGPGRQLIVDGLSVCLILL